MILFFDVFEKLSGGRA